MNAQRAGCGSTVQLISAVTADAGTAALRVLGLAAYALAYLAFVRYQRGDQKEVVTLCERGLALGGEASLGFLSPYLRGYLGLVQIRSGAVKEGLLALRNAIKAQTAMGFRRA